MTGLNDLRAGFDPSRTVGASGDEFEGRIAGDVVMDERPGIALRNWRERLGIRQANLAREMEVSPSVLSDYESGRRRHPGALFIRKYVQALVRLDRAGRRIVEQLSDSSMKGAILAMRELEQPIKTAEFLELVQGELLAGDRFLDTYLYGYTVLDSIKTIYALSGFEFFRIFGTTTERALVFTKVGLGHSPIVAVRVCPLKPRLLVMHGPAPYARDLAEVAERDRIVLALSKAPSVDGIIEALSKQLPRAK